MDSYYYAELEVSRKYNSYKTINKCLWQPAPVLLFENRLDPDIRNMQIHPRDWFYDEYRSKQSHYPFLWWRFDQQWRWVSCRMLISVIVILIVLKCYQGDKHTSLFLGSSHYLFFLNSSDRRSWLSHNHCILRNAYPCWYSMS